VTSLEGGEVSNMFNFWHKNKKELLESEEYHKLKKELLEVSANVSELESIIFKVENEIKTLRAMFRKKMYDAVSEEKQSEKDINRSVLLPE